MSNPVSFVNSYVDKVVQFVRLTEDLRAMNDMLVQDSSLVQRYFDSPGARTDIKAADVTAVHDALVQIIFAYDSGSPPQKAALFKMLP